MKTFFFPKRTLFILLLFVLQHIYAQPKITAFAPASANAGTVVTITGVHFTAATSVRFGNKTAASYTVVADSIIHATVGSGASGAVRVSTASGVDSLNGFTYIPPALPPVINRFTPGSGGAGATVTIYGLHFTGATAVRFGGTAATNFYILSDTSIIAYVGNGATGYVKIVTPNGVDSLPGFTFNAVSAKPVVTSFSPLSGNTGTSITISGSHFIGTSSVSFGGVAALSYTVQSDSSIVAVVGNGAGGAVRVSTANGVDSLNGFSYIPPALPPVINRFTPGSGGAGATVTIYGLHFTGATAVRFGGTAATNFYVLSDTSIIAYVGSGATGYVKIITPNGVDSLAGFTFNTIAAKPVVTSFSPLSANTGTPITISGSHFIGTSSVSFGGIAALSYTVQSDSSIVATVGNGASGAVRVVNSGGRDSLNGFVYTAPPLPLQLYAFNPSGGRSGTVITITGRHLTGTNAVNFGTVAAASFTVVSDSCIRAVVGAGATGMVKVWTADAGMDSLAGFTFIPYAASPVVEKFLPSSGKAGTVVVISGTHFTGTTAVSFGGVEAGSFAVLSDSSISAVVGGGATGYIGITTVTGAGSIGGFTFIPATPKVFSFTPASGPAGTTVRINGANFMNATAVSFGGTPAMSFMVVSDSVIDARIGNGVTGFVSTTTAGGTDSLGTFTFKQGIVLYPNPATSYVVINVPVSTNSSGITLSDFSGRVLREQPVSSGTTQVKINLSGIKQGIYVVKWNDGVQSLKKTILVE